MIEKFNVNLFLTNEEREDLLDMVDHFEKGSQELDLDDQLVLERWAKIALRLVFGKEGHYPLYLRLKDEDNTDESTY